MASSECCLLPGLGPHEGRSQSILVTPVGSLEPSPQPRLAEASHSQPAKPSQYLHLRCLLDDWLHPEGAPGPPSYAEAPGRDPFQRWLHLPTPQSSQPGAGRGARGSRESVSSQGRGRSYTPVFDPVFPSWVEGGGSVLGLSVGRAPLLVLLLSFFMSQQSNRGCLLSCVWKPEDSGFP